MSKVFYFLVIFFITLLALSGFFWFYEVQYRSGRASVSSYSFSVDNSYVFVTPLRAKANNKEKIRVTVFVLNNQGLGVLGKKVFLGYDKNLNIEEIQALTDNFGKAIFDVSSSKAGEFYLEIKIEDKILPQKAHLSFY